MQSPLGVNVGSVGGFWGGVSSEMFGMPIHMNAGQPFARSFAPSRAENARTTPLSWFAAILHILGVRPDAQVAPSIVRSNAVDMVDVSIWPVSRGYQICEAMRQILPLENANAKMSALSGRASSNTPRLYITYVDFPCDNTGQRVVVKNFPDFFCKG
jgi:hypothetical protein